jgi:FkbM family methyltransferase
LADVRQLVAGLATQFGYTIVPNWRMPRWQAAGYLRQLFEWLMIDLVLDVGGNRGQYRDFLRHEVGYRGRIITWEPVAEMASVLRRRAEEDAQWRIVECALGRSPGKANLHVTAESQFSSLHTPTAESQARFKQKTEYRVAQIEMRTLASEFAQHADWIGGRRIYLKMDTQGHDLDVLDGAGSAIELVDALQSEVAVRPIYEGVPDLPASLSRIRSLGFEPSGVFPNNEGHFPWLLELDMHFVARRHLPEPSQSA